MWDQAYEAVWWAQRYGWTPDQVDALPAHLHARMPLIAADWDAWVEEETRRRSQ